MIKEEMTIHTALRELNTIDKKLRKIMTDLSNATVVHPAITNKIASETVEEWKERKRDLYKSFKTNVNRRQAIKMAIAESNAKTTVKIKSYSDNPISVSAAIDLLNSGCEYESDLMDAFSRSYSSAIDYAERENKSVLAKADTATTAMFGRDKEGTASSVEAIAFREDYINKQGYIIEDPFNIPKLTTEEYERIENIKSEIDSALSNSNALTTITVEYENG